MHNTHHTHTYIHTQKHKQQLTNNNNKFDNKYKVIKPAYDSVYVILNTFSCWLQPLLAVIHLPSQLTSYTMNTLSLLRTCTSETVSSILQQQFEILINLFFSISQKILCAYYFDEIKSELITHTRELLSTSAHVNLLQNIQKLGCTCDQLITVILEKTLEYVILQQSKTWMNVVMKYVNQQGKTWEERDKKKETMERWKFDLSV